MATSYLPLENHRFSKNGQAVLALSLLTKKATQRAAFKSKLLTSYFNSPQTLPAQAVGFKNSQYEPRFKCNSAICCHLPRPRSMTQSKF